MLIFGHGLPDGVSSGNFSGTTIHGQPVLPAGGGGICCSVGQRIFKNEQFGQVRSAN